MKRKIQVASACFLIFAFFLNAIAEFNRLDHDLLHEMALAREAVELGRVPWRDSFAYTATVSPVVHHEWGTGLFLYSLVVLAGLGASGLMMIKFALSFATIWLTLKCSRRQSGAWPVIAALSPIAVALSCIGFQTIRAQVFTLLFTAVLLNLFWFDRRGNVQWTWLWLVLYVFWLNLHAGFLVGIGLFGCHLIERTLACYRSQRSISGTWRQTRHLYWTLAAMSVLWVLNPYLWHYGSYLIYAVRLDRPRIGEWSWIGADETSASVLVPAYSAALLLLAYSALQQGWRQMPGLLLVMVTAWVGFWHVRHVTIFALVWFSYVPCYVTRTELGRTIRKPWHQYPAVCSAILIVIGSYALWKPFAIEFWRLRIPTTGVDSPLLYPVGAVDYLERTGFAGNVMVPFSQGSYLSWRLAPQVNVSVDSRYEVAYETAWVERTHQLYEVGEGWKSVLDEYPTDAVLVVTDSPLMKAIEEQLPEQWHKQYEDPGFSLFVPTRDAARYPVEFTDEIPAGAFP